MLDKFDNSIFIISFLGCKWRFLFRRFDLEITRKSIFAFFNPKNNKCKYLVRLTVCYGSEVKISSVCFEAGLNIKSRVPKANARIHLIVLKI
jgi:hypothetical protein